MDNRDNVYVADRNNHRIQKFDSDGNFITKWGKEGIGDGEFYYPHDIAVDSSGNVYVAEEYNHRIQKFAPGIPEPPELSFTQHAPPSSNVATGTPNVLVNTLDFTATGEAIKVDKLNITLYGTGSPADLGDIKIYKETGGDGFDAVADIDISDSETADAWDGSVCTVTLGTDGSNDPQTIEVGDTTGYIVFDIAPTATTGNTVGGKIASGADISAKVDGETIVAQKVGDDPTEVRTILAPLSSPLETTHFKIHYYITGSDMVDLTDNKHLNDNPGEITSDTELLPGSNGRPDFVEKVGLSFEKAYHFLIEEKDFRPGTTRDSNKYKINIKGVLKIGNKNVPALCSGNMWDYTHTAIYISNNFLHDQSREYILFTCSHEYFHAIQHRYHGGLLEGSPPPWVLEGTAHWSGYEVLKSNGFDSNGFLSVNGYLTQTNKNLKSVDYGASLYWIFLTDNHHQIDFNGAADNIEIMRTFWEEIDGWNEENIQDEIDNVLTNPACDTFDDSFKAFAKANYFSSNWYDLVKINKGKPLDPAPFRVADFFSDSNNKISFSTEESNFPTKVPTIENYGVEYFKILVPEETREVKVKFDGYGSTFFVMEYKKGEESQENTLSSCTYFEVTLPQEDAYGTVYIIGRLDDSGTGNFEITFEDVTPSTPTATDSTILPTQQIPITTTIDPTTEATFKLFWQGSTLNLTLLTPEDVLIDPTTTDPDITHVKSTTYEYYTIKNPDPGDWTMNIIAVDVPPEGENFTAVVYVATNLTLSLDTDKYRYDPGESISIQASLTNNSTPVTGASVQAEVQRPEGSENITLFDDGTHSDAQANDGVYSSTYTDTSAGGTYIIKATARGTIDGCPFVRACQRSVLVQLAPDLIVADIIFSDNAPSSGDEITINASIQNIGDVNASQFTVDFYDGNPYEDGLYIGSEPITTNLTLGEAVNVATSWTAKSGSHNIFVRVPPLALEINESNNIANKTIDVTSIYNLSIIAAGTDKSICASDENVTIYCIVENADHDLFSPDIVYAKIKNHTLNLSEYSTGNYMGIFNQTSEAGTYDITLYANKTGYENDTAELSFEVVFDNQAPIAKFTHSPEHPVVNQIVTFNATSSYDPDGNITNYEWAFGDGTYGTGELITHSYSSAGNFTVNLTVTDNDGATNITAKMITVTMFASPTITSFAPPSHVNDTVCKWRTFNVTVDQKVNVSWYLNNTFQHMNESVREAKCTLHAAVAGEHNVTAKASNANGTDIHSWIWNVTAARPNCTCGDICVNETGWWRDGGAFNSCGTPLQAAIDNATAGALICVTDGTYTENVDVYKQLTIRSENGAASTSVRGASPYDYVFAVTADYVNISGFHVTSATKTTSGIYLYGANYCNISNNNANENFDYGIFLNSSSDNTLVNNTASDNGDYGIYLYLDSNNNYLIGNTASGNNGDGFKLESNSNHNRIIGNNASDNDNNGIRLYGTTGNPCSHNTVANNTADLNAKSGIIIEGADSDQNTIVNNRCNLNDYGISVRYGDYNNLTKNTCNQNTEYGIRLYQSADNNEIINNTAISNTEYGIYISSSDYNIIYNNYFENTNNARDDSTNIWNTTPTFGGNIIGGSYLGGNYWSDYTGKDETGDGLGDTMLPYNSSGNIQHGGDWHPLTETCKCGDVNGDGIVAMSDALAIVFEAIATSEWAADVNCDLKVTMSDALAIVFEDLNCCCL